jgi:lysozyme family protein
VSLFYFEEWWLKLMCDKIESDALALELYEMAVNCGPVAAIKNLQKCLNALNNRHSYWPDLTVDGRIGMNTVAAANRAMAFVPLYVGRNVVKLFNCEQGARYMDIAERRESQEVNLHGWLNMRVEV